MSKAAMIRARVDPELKEEAEAVLDQLGLTASDAIRLFYKQVVLQKGLPFKVEITNRETLEALENIRRRRNLKAARNADDLFEQAGVSKRGKSQAKA
jgi:DNA-damage-inducible protein J